MQNFKILILDDDSDILDVMQSHFKQHNFTATTTNDPRDALNLVERHKFDAILTDQRLPTINGTEFVKLLRHRHINCPVYFFTGYSGEITDKDVLELNITQIFRKGDHYLSPRMLPIIIHKDIKSQHLG